MRYARWCIKCDHITWRILIALTTLSSRLSISICNWYKHLKLPKVSLFFLAFHDTSTVFFSKQFQSQFHISSHDESWSRPCIKFARPFEIESDLLFFLLSIRFHLTRRRFPQTTQTGRTGHLYQKKCITDYFSLYIFVLWSTYVHLQVEYDCFIITFKIN